MAKRKVFLIRTSTGDQGTEGRLITAGFECFTMELPWRDNRKNVSCIPPGEYEAMFCHSLRFRRKLYLLLGTGHRTGIRIHSGNVAGDTSKGYKAHSYGCPLLGKYRGTLWGQKAILLSRVTLRAFHSIMDEEPFTLIIKEVY